jgi:hypothetical protein
MPKLDWAKPIQFENGEPCELIETNLEGYKQWGKGPEGLYPTRMIHRLGLDESTTAGIMAAHWFVYEDGQAPALLPTYKIINIP